MIMSGLKIYNASPIFDFKFPSSVTIGGWLGGALLWHFAAMWLLLANGLIYLGLNLTTKRAFNKFFSHHVFWLHSRFVRHPQRETLS
jgi:thiosulfate reductase cytochrome b subunit